MESQTHSLKNELYLVFQPIIHVLSEDNNEMTEFEVLLRSKKTHCYPKELMDTFILFEEKNKELLDWYEEEMTHICQKHPTFTFNFNIHPQQFLHPSTWEFLTRLQNCTKQINIELTEKPILKEIDEIESHLYMQQYIQKIKSLGYQISVDDVGSGQNTLELVSGNIEAISCLKFSLQSFRTTDMKTIRLFLNAWHHLACLHKLRIVVEGVEDREISNELFNQGIHWQQGYYWAKTVHL